MAEMRHGALYVWMSGTTWVLPIRDSHAVDGPQFLVPNCCRPVGQLSRTLTRLRVLGGVVTWELPGPVPQRLDQRPSPPVRRWRHRAAVAAWSKHLAAGPCPDGGWWVEATDQGGCWAWPTGACARIDVEARIAHVHPERWSEVDPVSAPLAAAG